MHNNEPKQESNQATLTRVKREWMSRAWPNPSGKKTVNQTKRQELEKLP
jgi:hypothetical protein